jgi:ribosome-binding factor A
MSTRRTSRIARVIKEAVSRALILDLADPRLGFITVTEVDVAPDMKTAKVKLSVLGDSSQANLCLKGIHQARGRIQRAVGDALTTKTVPHLEFELDESVKKSAEVARLLNLARSEYRLSDEEAAAAAESEDEESSLPDENDQEVADETDDAWDDDEDEDAEPEGEER